MVIDFFFYFFKPGLKLVYDNDKYYVWEYNTRSKDKTLIRKTGTYFNDLTNQCTCAKEPR